MYKYIYIPLTTSFSIHAMIQRCFKNILWEELCENNETDSDYAKGLRFKLTTLLNP